MLTMVPGFLLSTLNYKLAVLMPPLLFLLWNPALLAGGGRIPKRSYALLFVLTALTVLWFVHGWTYGLQYQGAQHTRVVCVVNVIWIALLWVLAVHSLKAAPSFARSLVFHGAVFAWLSWYAFPYLGELP
jgi:hypothetical protein